MSPSEDRKPAGSQEPEATEGKDMSTEQLGKLIEEARQAVKQVIKRELEGEVARCPQFRRLALMQLGDARAEIARLLEAEETLTKRIGERDVAWAEVASECREWMLSFSNVARERDEARAALAALRAKVREWNETLDDYSDWDDRRWGEDINRITDEMRTTAGEDGK